jgi:hypothetical protein
MRRASGKLFVIGLSAAMLRIMDVVHAIVPPY